MRRLAIILSVAALVYCADRESKADIYAYTDSAGTIHFSNAPAHGSYRLLIRERDSLPAMPESAAGERYQEIITSASERFGVDADLVRAVIKAESDYNALARSSKGAQGLMQLMPETARLHEVTNVNDPVENVYGGVRHLKLLLDRFAGNVQLTLAAYNAGIKAVERYRGVPPYPETEEYVRRVLRFHDRYRKNGAIALRQQGRP